MTFPGKNLNVPLCSEVLEQCRPVMCRRGDVQTHFECREKPEEEVAVVFFVDSQVAGVALDVGSRQLSDHTQSPGWKGTRQ